ncbi:hypothetical protein CEXT_132571 [Caerostris extrusa]|uniref:Uncharacterized protein n=1 Tax=Caerostris extrusa TaxID=172846 RepID=A0AAV4Y3L4_CAEEX|nr:hypothetical protein CEXT_132571 [Caerostris extrusa]
MRSEVVIAVEGFNRRHGECVRLFSFFAEELNREVCFLEAVLLKCEMYGLILDWELVCSSCLSPMLPQECMAKSEWKNQGGISNFVT